MWGIITLTIITIDISQINTKGTKFTQNTAIHYKIVSVCLFSLIFSFMSPQFRLYLVVPSHSSMLEHSSGIWNTLPTPWTGLSSGNLQMLLLCSLNPDLIFRPGRLVRVEEAICGC
jgi:hypothetical protein